MIALRIHQGRLEARGASLEDMERLVMLRDLWEERAGILESEAGLTREEAEARAMVEIMPRVEKVAVKAPFSVGESCDLLTMCEEMTN